MNRKRLCATGVLCVIAMALYAGWSQPANGDADDEI